MQIVTKTIYSKGKTILEHNTDCFWIKNVVKNKIFHLYVKIPLFLAIILNMPIRSLRRHYSACQHCFFDSAYQLAPNQGVNHFLHKMPVSVNFSHFFPDYMYKGCSSPCSFVQRHL